MFGKAVFYMLLNTLPVVRTCSSSMLQAGQEPLSSATFTPATDVLLLLLDRYKISKLVTTGGALTLVLVRMDTNSYVVSCAKFKACKAWLDSENRLKPSTKGKGKED